MVCFTAASYPAKDALFPGEASRSADDGRRFFAGQSKSAKAGADGSWSVRLDAMAANAAGGKLMPGDYIFGVDGKKFEGSGDAPYLQLSRAITLAETEKGAGKLTLMVRRGRKIMDVALQLEVLGTYNPTSPYFCQKTENLIDRAQKWVTDRCRPESGSAGIPEGMLGTDIWFLLAGGDPEVQGLVRRAVYARIAKMEPLTRHKRRWGALRGTYTTAEGFTIMLDARMKN